MKVFVNVFIFIFGGRMERFHVVILGIMRVKAYVGGQAGEWVGAPRRASMVIMAIIRAIMAQGRQEA